MKTTVEVPIEWIENLVKVADYARVDAMGEKVPPKVMLCVGFALSASALLPNSSK